MAIVCCAPRCTRSWIRRRAVKLSGLFAGQRDRCLESSRLRNAGCARWGSIFMSIFTSALRTVFPSARDMRLRIKSKPQSSRTTRVWPTCLSTSSLRRICNPRPVAGQKKRCENVDGSQSRGYSYECLRQGLPRSRDLTRKANQSPQARGMLAEIQHQLYRAGSLAFDIEQNVRRSWKRLTRCVADCAERKQWDTVLGASARDKLRFHIDRRGACRSRNFVSLLVGIDHRRHSQEIGDMDRQICQQRACLAQFGRREVLRQ